MLRNIPHLPAHDRRLIDDSPNRESLRPLRQAGAPVLVYGRVSRKPSNDPDRIALNGPHGATVQPYDPDGAENPTRYSQQHYDEINFPVEHINLKPDLYAVNYIDGQPDREPFFERSRGNFNNRFGGVPFNASAPAVGTGRVEQYPFTSSSENARKRAANASRVNESNFPIASFWANDIISNISQLPPDDQPSAFRRAWDELVFRSQTRTMAWDLTAESIQQSLRRAEQAFSQDPSDLSAVMEGLKLRPFNPKAR